MEKEAQLNAINQYVHAIFETDITGHDAVHMRRVADIAKLIATREQADVFIVETAALLHDVGDKKLFRDPNQSIQAMEDFLISIDLSRNVIQQIKDIIADISFSKGAVPESLEGKIIQDADRIDAMGAIGIARTFQYGGANGQMIYDQNDSHSSIQHFYDKLLILKDTLHTRKAKEIAEERHQFLLAYLEQFWKEWHV